MKKFILLIIAMFLISCSDNDDDDNSIESDKIIGEWYLYKDIDLEDNSVELYELSASDIEKITFS